MLGGIVRGTKVSLRVPTHADLPSLNHWAADMRVRRGGQNWHEPAMPATWRERFTEASRDRKSILWSIDEGDRLVGYCRVGLGWTGDDADLAQLVIDPGDQRRGLGFDAGMAVHRFLFDYHHLRVMAVALPADNEPALHVADKLGYQTYARGHAVYFRDGGYVDQIRLRLDAGQWSIRWSATEREYEPLPAAAAL